MKLICNYQFNYTSKFKYVLSLVNELPFHYYNNEGIFILHSCSMDFNQETKTMYSER